MLKFLFFAQLADDVGVQLMQVDYIEGWQVQQYLEKITAENTALKTALLDDESILVSVNQSIAARSNVLADGDEVGLLPPFSGG